MKLISEKDRLLENSVRRIFREVEHSFEAPPHLKTRVLATLRERNRNSLKLRFWKVLACASSLACVVAITLSFIQDPVPTYAAVTGKPFVVRIELEPFRKEGIRFAQIELPEGVTFYSEKYRDLENTRELKVAFAWNQNYANLPFVIRSSLRGSKKIRVRFLDESHHTVLEKMINLKFFAAQAPTSNGLRL